MLWDMLGVVVSLVIDIIFATLDARMTTHNTTKISEATHTHIVTSLIDTKKSSLTQNYFANVSFHALCRVVLLLLYYDK